MAQSARTAIARKLLQFTSCTESQLVGLLGTPKTGTPYQFRLPIHKLGSTAAEARTSTLWHDRLSKEFASDTFIAKAATQGPFLEFTVQPLTYLQRTLHQVYAQKERYGWSEYSGTGVEKPTVVIDYSSPNIAKPFHAGHLRSTIIGNFVKRVHEAMGYRVIGINYLGDWGKQYGLLAVGFEKYGDETALAKDPIHHLYEVYVKINADAAKDPNIDQQANDYFRRMEHGDEKALEQWRRFREMSIRSYTSIYKRLNIEFEQYSGESETEPYIAKVHQQLKQCDLITETDDGAWVVDLEQYKLGKPIVRRADGTSLYLTRDLASLTLRKEKYGFDKAVYVVGTEQSLYLQQVFKIYQLLQRDGHVPELHHVNFGRINGMSTRKGTVVFLQDILDTAQEKMEENMQEGGNQMKYDQLYDQGLDNGLVGQDAIHYIADKLGTSAVIVQDMVAKRIKNYQFSWDRMTKAQGYTGVYLQFTYARMCGIERYANTPIRPDCDLSLLKEKEAFELGLIISQFPDIVRGSYRTMDPCTLVQYLFKLSHAISQANHLLRVKDTDKHIAEPRMLLFWAAKTTLANGLRLIGIEPLERM
ncbi:arginyl-tRNA synthetase [Radiomyces spectabilis]|uniref:arginyl-tRNA synthetase n=1 Tax=Radiomyces spectabilis TaxID=64574 RepID=UPI00221F0268|nr:arginyl-tRNA synthetase [Radiomyces spectabilis]KAI8381438.1 arginyl-tRNA synthetase [Radiomyces spectabilis]